MRSGFSFAVAAMAVTSASAQLIEFSVDQDSTLQMPTGNNNLDVGGYSRADLGNAAINAPGGDCESYIGHTVYRDGKPFDPARCIKDCEETTRYNQATGGRGICRFANTYILVKNGKPDGQVCAMYTRAWGEEFAVNTGYHTQDAQYTINSSYSYSNKKDPGNDKSCLNVPAPKPDPEPSQKPEPTSTPTSKPDEPKPTSKPEDPKPDPTPTPAPNPPNEGIECFKARAWSPANKLLNGRWLDSKFDKLSAYWKFFEKEATTFYIDREGLWRNAATDSVAMWDPLLSKTQWGYIKFDGWGWGKWPQVTQCKIENRNSWGGKFDELICGKNGEEFKAKGFLLTWRFDHPGHANPVRIEAVRAQCPSGSKKWW